MNNKAVRRIFKKALGVSSKEEIQDLIKSFEIGQTDSFKEFELNFFETLDALDTAFNDLEKVIEIRDRSLAVSSNEMIAMNNQLTAEGEQRRQVIARLQVMLKLLSGKEQEAVPANEDLERIIESVSQLIKNQIEATRSLQVLFEEGRKIASAMSYSILQSQLHETLEVLNVKNPVPTLFLAGHLLGLETDNNYYLCDDRGQILDQFHHQENSDESLRFIKIDSTKGNQPLALIAIECPPGSPDLPGAMRLFQALVPNIAATVENIHLLKEEKLKEHLANELKTARFVQQTLLPPPNPISKKGFEVHGYYESASECGGDWWNYNELEDGRALVLVGDVTGHGTASAMISAVVKGYCDSLFSRKHLKPSDILLELNAVIFKMGEESRRAMSMTVLIFDPKEKKIEFSNAGHPHPIVLNQATPKYLIASGSILGISMETRFTDKTISYAPGERFVLYSDGLTESINDRNEMYGDRRLIKLLGSLDAKLSSEDITQALLGDRKKFSQGEPLNDDITTVVIKTL